VKEKNPKNNKNNELYEDIYKEQFSFGKNWSDFLKSLDKKKVEVAKKSLLNFTDLKSFKNKTFLDIGSGSGLFSLSAILLGAKKVTSVDVDENSVLCTKYLREKYDIDSKKWEIKKGSALDKNFIGSLDEADILYSWGVLHHTGNMWQALENVSNIVKKNGIFYLAIYNNFEGLPFSSKTWVKLKRFYSKRGKLSRKIIDSCYIAYYIAGLLASGKNPYKYIKNYKRDSLRGMSFYYDAIDWLGGYPYEYASVNEIKKFYWEKGFKLKKTRKTKREGCNEFLFMKNG